MKDCGRRGVKLRVKSGGGKGSYGYRIRFGAQREGGSLYNDDTLQDIRIWRIY